MPFFVLNVNANVLTKVLTYDKARTNYVVYNLTGSMCYVTHEPSGDPNYRFPLPDNSIIRMDRTRDDPTHLELYILCSIGGPVYVAYSTVALE